MQIGGLALNSKQFSLALRSFQTANRLSAGSEQEDSTFGIAMCLAQDNKLVDAAVKYELVFLKQGPRSGLAGMAALVNRARAGFWPGFEQRAERLLHAIVNWYLPSITRGRQLGQVVSGGTREAASTIAFDAVHPWSCIQPHEALILPMSNGVFRALSAVHAQSQAVMSGSLESIPPQAPGPVNNKKFTLAYMSSDFKAHATSHLLKGAFSRHNKTMNSVHCFSVAESDMVGDDDSHWYSEIAHDCSMHSIPQAIPAGSASALFRCC